MQAPPAHEAMYLHGILHRVEGDYDNARAWYGNVEDSEVFKTVWADAAGTAGIAGKAGEGGAWRLIDDVERLRKGSKVDKERINTEALGRRSLAEIRGVVAFCERKFGTGRVEDAREVWVLGEEGGEKEKTKMQEMVVGGEGWREF